MKMLAHENYFDAVVEENLLAVIRTNRRKKQIFTQGGPLFENRFTFFSICVCVDDANADAIVNPRILSNWDDDDDEFNRLFC